MDPTDWKTHPLSYLMTLGKGAYIEPCCTILHPERLILEDGAYIGYQTFIDATGGVTIGERVRTSFRCVIMSNTHHISPSVYRRSIAGDRHRPTVIERGCWIGANVTIYPGVTIGEGCVINAGSIIKKSTEANSLYNPSEAYWVKHLLKED